MNQDYIKPDAWSVIEEGFDAERVKSSESLFSIGNGAMGQRANFEETYSGETFQGSYIAGIYYPDKTRVGWWKNGYPEYFAKVLNAPNWIGIDIVINGENLDLHRCQVSDFRRELNMREGWYHRSFTALLQNGTEIRAEIRRFLSMEHDQAGMIRYSVTPVNRESSIEFRPYLDAGVQNEDANWEEKFWEPIAVQHDGNSAFVTARTFKTHFGVATFMHNEVFVGTQNTNTTPADVISGTEKITFSYPTAVKAGQTATIEKTGGYTVTLNHKDSELIDAAKLVIHRILEKGFDTMLRLQAESWAAIWDMSDITIDGDVKAQQGIRFNIFQLNQTYSGKDSRLNIGPKGFTGEKYGGSTYWDTEAYCIPFYMATKDQGVARNLLTYRYNQLGKAIENAAKLGFTNGAALFPMVTMNGEECHNEWEITFEEIHRNGAIAFAIYNYHRFTGDYSYIPEKGLEVLIAIARFWQQRATWSTHKNQYMILGVTGPNEYENNVNNNWYTNYLAKWCIEYAMAQIEKVKTEYPSDFSRIVASTKVDDAELLHWKKVADKMYFPYDEELDVFLQQDGFLDKELVKVSDLDKAQRPINQKWSWDRILRSPYIKQADVLQGFYFFEDHFTREQLEKHFDFYEPFTVHESSLSPCVHSIQAAVLDKMDMAYTFYLRTSRLDLDDYNKEVEEGCHITSMAGTWMSIVEGFGGMRVKDDVLHFTPRIPKQWKGYSFKINFRNQVLKVMVEEGKTSFGLDAGTELKVVVNGSEILVEPNALVTV